MEFEAVLEQTIALLQRQGRISYIGSSENIFSIRIWARRFQRTEYASAQVYRILGDRAAQSRLDVMDVFRPHASRRP